MLKLKDEGNRLFGRKEYQKALEAYDRALKAVNAEAKDDLALLHSNKAACFMMFQRCWQLPLSMPMVVSLSCRLSLTFESAAASRPCQSHDHFTWPAQV